MSLIMLFSIIDKIRDGKIDLSDVKNNQETFKSYETKLLNLIMIILQ